MQWPKLTQKVESDEERVALKNKLIDMVGAQPKGGYIIRTAALDAPNEDWQNDINYLTRAWQGIVEAQQKHPAPYLIHKDFNNKLGRNFDFNFTDGDGAFSFT